MKKIKQEEKVKVTHELNFMNKKSFVNPSSRELLRQKNERELKLLEEERFDKDDFEEVLSFSPSRMITSPS